MMVLYTSGTPALLGSDPGSDDKKRVVKRSIGGSDSTERKRHLGEAAIISHGGPNDDDVDCTTVRGWRTDPPTHA
ncbi:hypothetical protein L596_018910 [Steinernema carpocapsae]|uniref:Uncharacterized protein n=1 Tax=Steinernema carpocapsae TaxID=34508 RepID=A0A4U5N699_STECR|nr:hypothetical protein L596_018910 [Steinernema carpocapsae]